MDRTTGAGGAVRLHAQLQKRAGWVCLGVGLLALAIRLALLPVRPIPQPAVHDEFAYLLGAETFCLGRVTNPPHRMWVHFETFHENFQPTYASKYPPAQSLFLALGWKLFGNPWYGVWLSCGLMCAALCWMLQGWLPPRYALLGGLMAVAQWGIAGNWINSYMGGAVAAAAGALVLGAVPRLARRPTTGVAALAALGAVALANSRPYEGAVTAAGAAIALLIWRWRSRRPFRDLLVGRVAAPAGAILGCGLAAMLYYNYRVTGNPLQMPYALHQAQYGFAPIFWIMPLGPPPVYRHEAMRRFWEVWDMSYYRVAREWPPRLLIAFLGMLRYFVTPVSAVALFTAVLVRRGRKVQVALALAAAPVAGLLLERFSTAQYFAPATGLVLLLAALGAQCLRVKFGVRLLAIFVTLFFADAAYDASRLTNDEYPHKPFTAHRLAVMHRMQSEGGRHLAIVRYAPDHNFIEEWVYNRADIDGSAIVWARDMGDAANRELLDYYHALQPGRKAWLVEADAADPQAAPYAPR
ncbi:MAG TPA: hypothetical protein VN924_15910 [Bryobacteraceae bacterium]|nr:hypothetical protein [Bryobacteraceae bacterium]